MNDMFFAEADFCRKYNLIPLSNPACLCSLTNKQHDSANRCALGADISSFYQRSDGGKLLLWQVPIAPDMLYTPFITWAFEAAQRWGVYCCVFLHDGWFSENYGTVKFSDKPFPEHYYRYNLRREID